MKFDRLRHNRSARLTLMAALIGAIFGARIIGHSAVPLDQVPADMMRRFEAKGFTIPLIISLALWAVISVYWEVAARNETKVKEAGPSRAVHLVLTSVAQLLVFLPLPGLRARFIPASSAWIAGGLALEVFSVWITIWARRTLGRHWSGAIATNVDHELVRSGPYRFARHPIYTGLLGLYVGTALVSGEVHALMGVVVALIAYWRKIRMEERHLVALFGPEYEGYRKSTKALVPGIY